MPTDNFFKQLKAYFQKFEYLRPNSRVKRANKGGKCKKTEKPAFVNKKLFHGPTDETRQSTWAPFGFKNVT